MKPRTEHQKKVIGCSTKLRPITDKQTFWAYEKCLRKYAVVSRKTMFCLECGHSWKNEQVLASSLTGCVCPSCGNDLELKQPYQPTLTDSAYFAILTTKDEMQVVRMFFVGKKMKRGTAAFYYCVEVMQHWIDPSGSVTTMAKSVMGLSQYFDQWKFDSNLELRPKTYETCPRYTIGPYKIYPERRILPVIKRNGFNGYFYGLTPQSLFSTILKDPFAETLLKANQISFLEYYIRNKHDLSKTYWGALKICIRNGYIIKDAQEWIDYLKLLAHFGKDTHNAKYVCPKNLKAAHDKLVVKKREQDKRMRIEELRKRIDAEQVEYAEQKKRFLDLLFDDGEIVVKPLATVEEFMYEGDELKHCVFTNEYYKKQDSLVMSARIENKPIETIEISISNLSILQARGLMNKSTQYHGRIIELVKNNMAQISQMV